MPDGPLSYYRARLQAGEIRSDPAQELAAEKLESLHHALKGYLPQSGRAGWKERFGLAKRRIEPPQGLYIFGGVGRGKSMLMDIFFRCAPIARKRRVHFHAFMQEMHGMRRALGRGAGAARKGKGPMKLQTGRGDDLIARVAARVAEDATLLCFDEFQVLNVADAMILGRLFEAFFDLGVVVVATSNRPPRELYKNGLQRENFLPFIGVIEQKLDILHLELGDRLPAGDDADDGCLSDTGRAGGRHQASRVFRPIDPRCQRRSGDVERQWSPTHDPAGFR